MKSATLPRGEFRFRSGETSSTYFHKYRFEDDPSLLTGVVAEMIVLLPEDGEVVAGLELGGVPIATALSSVPRPVVLDNGSALALGYLPVTEYAAAVGDTCDELAKMAAGDLRARFAILAAYPYDLFDYQAEDAALDAADQMP